MKHVVSRFRVYAFPLLLFILACTLFASNIANPFFETGLNKDNNVILKLYQATDFVYSIASRIIPNNFFPFILLFAGMMGVFQLLISFKLYSNRYLPFIGAVFYALNLGTFWFFTYASLPLLFLFAFLPWQIWILLQIMKVSSMKRGEKLILFFLIQLSTAPAFSYPSSFTFFLVLVALLCFSMLFSRSFFRVMGHGPLYIIFIILLQLYWFLPRLYLLIDNNRTVLAFKEAINQSLKVISFSQFIQYAMNQPPVLLSIHCLFLFVIVLGIIKITRYHFPFLFTGILLSIPFWLKLPIDIPALKSFLASITLPSILFFLILSSFFFVNGLDMILEIYKYVDKKLLKRHSHHQKVSLSSVVRSPFELYQEIVEHTHKNHQDKHFTPLQFTEHFLHHLLTVKNNHMTQAEKRTHMEVRYVSYAAFLLIIVTGITGFQGKYFGTTEPSVAKRTTDIKVQKLMSALPPEKKAIITQYTDELDLAVAKENPMYVQKVIEKYNLNNTTKVQLFQTLPNIGPPAAGILEDYAFENHGNYFTGESHFDVYYPFRVINGSDFSAEDKNTLLKQEIQQSLMKTLGDYDIEIATESSAVTVVNSKGESLTFETSPYVEMNGDKLTLSFESRPIEAIQPQQFSSFSCPESTECYEFKHTGLEHQFAYLVTVTSTSKNPDILPFTILDTKHTHTYFDGKIDSVEQNIVLPPSYEHGVGYSFIMKSPHYKDWVIHISYLPYKDIQGVRFISKNGVPTGAVSSLQVSVKEHTPAYYELHVPPLSNPQSMTLAFYQDIDDGWKAYKIDQEKISSVFDKYVMKLYPFTYLKDVGKHSSFNTWANSWQLTNDWSNSTVYLIFWPQYLAYAGYAILTLFFLLCAIIWFSEWYRSLND